MRVRAKLIKLQFSQRAEKQKNYFLHFLLCERNLRVAREGRENWLILGRRRKNEN